MKAAKPEFTVLEEKIIEQYEWIVVGAEDSQQRLTWRRVMDIGRTLMMRWEEEEGDGHEGGGGGNEQEGIQWFGGGGLLAWRYVEGLLRCMIKVCDIFTEKKLDSKWWDKLSTPSSRFRILDSDDNNNSLAEEDVHLGSTMAEDQAGWKRILMEPQSG
eukprot:GHVS01015863.1.p2 GENE.GHVS01015863.1~~GHVS01015863.1.p2  ORF type:complete len:158 (+),score=43.09 GHVS01015863.1:796-1269(+)